MQNATRRKGSSMDPRAWPRALQFALLIGAALGTAAGLVIGYIVHALGYGSEACAWSNWIARPTYGWPAWAIVGALFGAAAVYLRQLLQLGR